MLSDTSNGENSAENWQHIDTWSVWRTMTTHWHMMSLGNNPLPRSVRLLYTWKNKVSGIKTSPCQGGTLLLHLHLWKTKIYLNWGLSASAYIVVTVTAFDWSQQKVLIVHHGTWDCNSWKTGYTELLDVNVNLHIFLLILKRLCIIFENQTAR